MKRIVDPEIIVEKFNKNRERHYQYTRNYALANKDRTREYARNFKERHKEDEEYRQKMREYAKNYYHTHKKLKNKNETAKPIIDMVILAEE